MSRISAVREDDGTVRHLNSLDLLVFGDRDEPGSARMLAIEAALTGAGFKAQRSEHVLQAMWDKWVTIASAAGSTVLMRASVGDIVRAEAQWIVHALIAECAGIAEAEGYRPDAAYLAQIAQWFTQAESRFTASMLRDLESGGPIEGEAIFGDLLRKGEARGVQTPVLRLAWAHARCYEERRRREGSG